MVNDVSSDIFKSRKSQYQILFLCATMGEVGDMGTDVLSKVSYFEHRAICNLQCYLEKRLDKSEFKLNLSSSELVNWPSCPVTNEIHIDDYFMTRIVFSVNQDALNRVKIIDSKMYKFLSQAIDGRLLQMQDFTEALNTSNT